MKTKLFTRTLPWLRPPRCAFSASASQLAQPRKSYDRLVPALKGLQRAIQAVSKRPLAYAQFCARAWRQWLGNYRR